MQVPRILATHTGEMPAVAEGDPAARVVLPKDVRALEKATRELLRTRVEKLQIRQRALRLEKRYSWAGYVHQHIAAYRQLTQNIAGIPQKIG